MSLVLILSGCDWVRSKLGMATSEDIAALKAEQERIEAQRRSQDSLQRAKADSVSRAFADSVAMAKAAGIADMSKTERYHVILGSFRDYNNSQRMTEKLKKDGYNPLTIDFKNGFRLVSVSSHNNLSAAFNNMYSMMDTKYNVDGDFWVYDIRQGLHIK